MISKTEILKKFDKNIDLSLKLFFKNKEFQSYISIYNLSSREAKSYMDSYLCINETKYFNSIDDVGSNKINYLNGRIAAKSAISRLTEIDDKKSITIDNGIFGQPIVNCPVNNISVSISHSNNYAAALALHESYPTGIDIENITLQKIENSKSQLTKNEMANLLDLKQKNALMLWTAKEALSKTLKTGINCDFAIYEISKIEDRGYYIKSNFVNFPQYQAASYFFKDMVFSFILPEPSEFFISEMNP